MQLVEVTDKSTARKFLACPVPIYRPAFPEWIRPLDQDIERIFDRKKNKTFRNGDAIRWILLDKNGKCIGRTAAFVNEKTANKYDYPTGGMGFFECIDNQEAANMLFKACQDWLAERNMEAMDGPINFGGRDNWWGLLVDGFYEPIYTMNFHPPYYRKLFEGYGFQVFYEQYVFYRNILSPIQEKFWEKYERLDAHPDYSFDHVHKNDMEKAAYDLKTVFNGAWSRHAGFSPMNDVQAAKSVKMLKPVLAEELAWFAYHKGEPIGFFLMIPDINQVFKHFNGRFGLVEKLRTLVMLKRRRFNKCYGIGFGVVPEHQGKGVEGGLIVAASLVVHPDNHWEHMEMNWIGDFNPKMINVATGVGGKRIKTYVTMRKLFDPERPFERAPII